MNKWIVILVIVLVIVLALAIWYKSKDVKYKVVSESINSGAFESRYSGSESPVYVGDFSEAINQRNLDLL